MKRRGSRRAIEYRKGSSEGGDGKVKDRGA